MQTTGVFYDGATAQDHNVNITIGASDITIEGVAITARNWALTNLHPIDPPTAGTPFRLTNDLYPGERLIIMDEAVIVALLRQSPALKGGYTKRHFGQVAGWTLAGFAALAVLAYVTLSWLPELLAPMLPDAWREKTGKQIESTVIESAKECVDSKGLAALGAMIANLSQGNDFPPLSVKIYDLPIVNAFAVSGGRVIMTRALIEAADTPEEITGVLAHEIGHVFHLHPEEQIVRLTGLQILMSIVGGSGGGEIVTNTAALATVLRYSREAEEEADSYARVALTNAKINPLGFKTFFEKIMKLGNETKKSTETASTLDRLGSVFSTHPDTEDRIKKIEPLPAGVTAVPSLSANEWLAMKKICDTKK